MKNNNEEGLDDILKGMINELDLKHKLYQTKIQEIWPQLMGQSISNYTRSIKVRKRKLYIEIISAPLKQELTYGRDKIKKNLNEELGEDYIIDVVVR